MKTQDYLEHNGHITRENGNTWKVIAVKLGQRVLVDAECVFGAAKGQVINLLTARTNTSKTIRSNIGLNLVS